MNAVFALLALLALLPWPQPAQPANGAVDIGIEPLTSAVMPGQEWLTLVVSVRNASPDTTGTLVVDAGTRYTVALPGGAEKRVPLTVPLPAETLQIRFETPDAAYSLAPITLQYASDDARLIGLISPEEDLLVATSAVSPSLLIQPVALADLPPDSAALGGFSALVIHETDTSRATVAQRRALAAWVGQGGTLILGGGIGAAQTADVAGALAPADIGGNGGAVLAPLGSYAPDATPPTGTAPVTLIPRTGSTTAADGLIASRQIGRGQVIQLAFDPANMRDWPGAGALLVALLGRQPARLPGATDVAPALPTLPDASLPLPLLIALGTLAAALIGPLPFFALRHWRRLRRGWAAIPLAAFLAALLVPLLLRTLAPPITEQRTTIIRGSEGQAAAQAFTVTRINAGTSTAIAREATPAPLINLRTSLGTSTVYDEAGTARLHTLLGAGSDWQAIQQYDTDLPVIVTGSVTETTGWQGELVATGAPLMDAILIGETSMVQVGTLAPDQSVDVAALSAIARPSPVKYTGIAIDRLAGNGPALVGTVGDQLVLILLDGQ